MTKKWKILIFSDELLYTSGSAWRAFLGALKAQKSPKMIPTSFKGVLTNVENMRLLALHNPPHNARHVFKGHRSGASQKNRKKIPKFLGVVNAWSLTWSLEWNHRDDLCHAHGKPNHRKEVWRHLNGNNSKWRRDDANSLRSCNSFIKCARDFPNWKYTRQNYG